MDADFASARFIPPAFGDMVAFLRFGQLLDFVARVAKHAVKNAASGVLTVVVAIVGQFDHALGQQNDLSEMMVTRFHGFKLSEGVGGRRSVWQGRQYHYREYQDACQSSDVGWYAKQLNENI